jgi:thioredoxin 1
MKQWYYTFIYKVLFFNKKESLYMSNVIEITDENFEIEVLQEEKLTLVDFWATWCGPCRKLAPIIDELSDDFKDKVKFVKIKADENIVTAQKYSVI